MWGEEQQPQPQQPKCPCFSFYRQPKKGGMEFESMGNHSFGILWVNLSYRKTAAWMDFLNLEPFYDDWESRANKAKHAVYILRKQKSATLGLGTEFSESRVI